MTRICGAGLSFGTGSAIRQALMKFRILFSLLFALSSAASFGEEKTPAATAPDPAALKKSMKISPELEAALAKLEMPGVKINLEEWSVDVDSRVCLKEGMLELIACTKDTKEHESVIVIDGKPSHIHTALLLLGAKPGNPAMHQPVDPEMTRFISKPPSGNPVDVYLVIKDAAGKAVEKPINEFIVRAEDYDQPTNSGEKKEVENFPTHTFLFAGSILVGEGDGPRRYLCDLNGNVISIATFGDELLCLPDIHDDANSSLVWEVDGDKLPELDSKVILRLRPQVKP